MAGKSKVDDKAASAGAAASAPEKGRDVYIANFEGDEINGRRYSLGDRIADDVDGGTIAYLLGIGRITHTTEADSKQPAVGGDPDALAPQGDDPNHAPADPLAGVTLSDDETTARDKLVEDAKGNADGLREIAGTEGVAGVTPSDDAERVATLIVVHRRPAA